MAKTSPKAPIDKELIKAKAREQVASRKLDRLKDRYERLKVITDTQFENHTGERDKLESQLVEAQQQNEELLAKLQGVKDEAAMWKAQLFDQLDRADAKHQEFLSLQTELADAQWQMVELINEERIRCETERARAEIATEEAHKQLVAARARVDGLKNLGTCLTAKLERATAQRKVLQREHARLVEVAEARALQLEARDEEIEELRVQLFEARRQILSHRLDSETWDALKEGLDAPVSEQLQVLEPESALDSDEVHEWDVAHLVADSSLQPPRKAIGHRQVKLAPLPAQASSPSFKPMELLGRATKTVGGWFKLKG